MDDAVAAVANRLNARVGVETGGWFVAWALESLSDAEKKREKWARFFCFCSFSRFFFFVVSL